MVPFDRGRHWTPVKLCPYGEGHARCKDSKQHHVMFHELYSVSLLLCIAQNVRFEIPYKVLYFETPFLIIFKYYAWASYGGAALKHYFYIMQITSHNLCLEFKSKCEASNAPLHQESTKILSNYSRTQMLTGNISHIALIKLYSIQIAH